MKEDCYSSSEPVLLLARRTEILRIAGSKERQASAPTKPRLHTFATFRQQLIEFLSLLFR
jgi:hypothetical protein